MRVRGAEGHSTTAEGCETAHLELAQRGLGLWATVVRSRPYPAAPGTKEARAKRRSRKESKGSDMAGAPEAALTSDGGEPEPEPGVSQKL